jgi:SAM-dependent methyltransferase
MKSPSLRFNMSIQVLFFLLLIPIYSQWTSTTAFMPTPRVFPTRRHYNVRDTPNSLILHRSHSKKTNGVDITSSEQSSRMINSKAKLVLHEFVSHVQNSVENQSFVSLTLRGVKRKKKTNDVQAASLRGSIRQVQGRLVQVKNQEKPILQLTLKYHGATDIAKNVQRDEISDHLAQLIMDPSIAASEWGVEAIQSQPIQGGECRTLENIWDLQQVASKSPKLVSKRVETSLPQDATSVLSHDRVKQVPLDNQADFLQALGVTKPDGKPRPGMQSKLRQCQKFVEIVGGLVEKVPGGSDRPISVVDMGCGRGYLTFALHAHLCEKYAQVASKGIDVRPKLVEEISGIAQSLGGDFKTLKFEEGTIEEVAASVDGDALKDDVSDGSLDILIALHACDTATDDALWAGISRGADLLVVAPCCHKQVRPQLNAHVATDGRTHPLADVLQYGVYRERLAETATDSLRALLLERAGYNVNVFEFIGGEHTSKNVMITAIKSRASRDFDDVDQRIQALAAFHGVKQQKLAAWMGNSLGESGEHSGNMPKLSVNRMPPKVKSAKAVEPVGAISSSKNENEQDQVAGDSTEDLEQLTIAELKERLRDAGLPISGRKGELIDRLASA